MFFISNSVNVHCRKKQIIITLARLQRWVKTMENNVNGQLDGCNVYLTFGGVTIKTIEMLKGCSLSYKPYLQLVTPANVYCLKIQILITAARLHRWIRLVENNVN